MKKVYLICIVSLLTFITSAELSAQERPGSDPIQWRAKLASIANVLHQDVFPGIDLAVKGNRQILSAGFIVNPEADPGMIHLDFAAAGGLTLDAKKNVQVQSSVGAVRVQRASFYQEIGGKRQAVQGEFVQRSGWWGRCKCW